jgi:hypothetical protein
MDSLALSYAADYISNEGHLSPKEIIADLESNGESDDTIDGVLIALDAEGYFTEYESAYLKKWLL